MIKNELSKALILESNQESINKVNTFIDEVYAEYTEKLNDSYGNMIVTLTEAVNNAITHGNKNDEMKKVTVLFTELNSGVSFEIVDEGEGFDHTNIPDPTTPENLEKINGRGIFLMTQLADKIEFLENGKKIQLIFNFA
ncbi:MAG: ATP-binding protein [Flavobacteriales bacterium]